jgi:uncharacterized protein (DUF427 family)
MKAIWNNQILAESEDTVVVENNHYFPVSSVNTKFFSDSKNSSFCPWKGQASYYSIEVDGETNEDTAWFYAEPYEAASQIKDRVAFWKGVQVTD